MKFVEPAFPHGLRLLGITSGYAIVAMTVDHAGRVIDIYSTEYSHRRFADASVAALSKWVFAPAEAGVSLPRFFPVRINYRVEGVILVMTSVDDSRARYDRLQGADAATKSFPVEILDRFPESRHAPMPVYPETLKAEKKTGSVEVRFYIDRAGKIRVPHVLHSDDPRFAEAAMAVIGQWSFTPPMRNGRPVSAFAVQEFTFGPRVIVN